MKFNKGDTVISLTETAILPLHAICTVVGLGTEERIETSFGLGYEESDIIISFIGKNGSEWVLSYEPEYFVAYSKELLWNLTNG